LLFLPFTSSENVFRVIFSCLLNLGWLDFLGLVIGLFGLFFVWLMFFVGVGLSLCAVYLDARTLKNEASDQCMGRNPQSFEPSTYW